MKILHYIPSVDESSGGVGAYMQLLTRDLGKLCELHIVTHKRNNERELENGKLHYIPYKWLPWNNCKKEFIALLEEIKPDVFHSNCCWMPVSALTVMWASKLRAESLEFKDLKIIYTPHGMLEPYAISRHHWKKLPAILLFQRKGLEVSDVIHSTAETEKANLLKLGWNKNIHVIPNCVQIDEIECKVQPQSLPAETEDGTDETNNNIKEYKRSKNILFLSRVHPKKGINFLIEAVAFLKKELKGYTITIAGPGDNSYFDELIELCQKNDIYVESFRNNGFETRNQIPETNEPKVSFIGPVYGNAKWPLYRNADLFVLPTYSENFGIVVPEALASGTPVITTVGTPWEELNGVHNENPNVNCCSKDSINHKLYTINSCQCGWCVEVGTEPLVEALKEFLACSDEELEQMGRNGRKLVEDKYTSEAIAKQFIEMYREPLRNSLMKERTPLKVLTFITGIDLGSGGPSRSVPVLVKGLAEEGVDITFMTYRSDNMNFHALDGTSAKLKILEKHTSTKDIEKFIAEEGFNIIQMQSIWAWSYHEVAKIARKHNIPYLITPRGMLEPWSLRQKKWKKKLGLKLYQFKDLEKAACIFTTADMEAQHVRELGIKTPISIIPNGIETEGYPCRTSMEGVKKQILFLSRIHVKKGIEILIEAFSHLHEEFKDWNVVVVGNGEQDYIDSLKLKVKSLGLEDCFKILPPVYGKDKVKLYQESSIFCLPSYSENFGMVIAEAMSCGVPVITTTGTPWEHINTSIPLGKGRGETPIGWCVELSVENIESTLRKAMSLDPSILYEMGQRGNQLIQDTYNYHSVAKKTKELFECIVNKR